MRQLTCFFQVIYLIIAIELIILTTCDSIVNLSKQIMQFSCHWGLIAPNNRLILLIINPLNYAIISM